MSIFIQSTKKLIHPIYKFMANMASKLFPVKNTIVLESFPDFSDNTFVLYECLLAHNINHKFEIIWLVDDLENANKIIQNTKNVRAVLINNPGLFGSVKSQWIQLRVLSSCKFFFFGNRPLARSFPKKNQTFVYLTHGIGLKLWKSRAFNSKYFTYIVSSSEYTGEILQKNFDNIMDRLLITGYPRNELLLNEDQCLVDRINVMLNNTGLSIIVWMPTYRRNLSGETNDSKKTEHESDLPIITNDEQWINVNNTLLEKNILLVIKPHPSQDLSKLHLKELSNIRVVTNQILEFNNIQTYSLLSVSNSLITDYSSVYFDYLLCNRPIAYTFDDYEKYENEVGFVVDDPKTLMPGSYIYNYSDFLTYLQNYQLDLFKEERGELFSKIHTVENDNFSFNVLASLGLVENEHE